MAENYKILYEQMKKMFKQINGGKGKNRREHARVA